MTEVQTGWDPAGDAGPDCEQCHHEYRGMQCNRDDCPGVVARDGTAQARIMLAHELTDYDPALIPMCWWCNGPLDLDADSEVVCVSKTCAMGGITGVDWDTEPDNCSYMTFRGSHNDHAGNFGPDEYCEDYALPDKHLCPAHDAADDRW